MSLMVVLGQYFNNALKLSTRYTGSGASWEVQAKIRCFLYPAFPTHTPSKSFKVTCKWLLLVLGLVVSR